MHLIPFKISNLLLTLFSEIKIYLQLLIISNQSIILLELLILIEFYFT